MKSLTDLVGGEEPHVDDVEDLFNLLDVNGDETIDRNEFKSLIHTFFKILTEKKIDVRISR
jgi:Ca2+-binding EF-hand superfamily protein